MMKPTEAVSALYSQTDRYEDINGGVIINYSFVFKRHNV